MPRRMGLHLCRLRRSKTWRWCIPDMSGQIDW
jgi:hypothetical protein